MEITVQRPPSRSATLTIWVMPDAAPSITLRGSAARATRDAQAPDVDATPGGSTWVTIAVRPAGDALDLDAIAAALRRGAPRLQ